MTDATRSVSHGPCGYNVIHTIGCISRPFLISQPQAAFLHLHCILHNDDILFLITPSNAFSGVNVGAGQAHHEDIDSLSVRVVLCVFNTIAYSRIDAKDQTRAHIT